MKRVVSKPRNEDFLMFMKRILEDETNRKSWIYISTDMLGFIIESYVDFIEHMDINMNLHLANNKIIIERYNSKYAWHKIASINSNTVCFNCVADPAEVLFITTEE